MSILKSIKLFILGLFCKHKDTTLKNKYYNECHGKHLCEYDEACIKCGKTRKFAYGNYTKWERNR